MALFGLEKLVEIGGFSVLIGSVISVILKNEFHLISTLESTRKAIRKEGNTI